MANNVIAQILGAPRQIVDNVETVSDVKDKLNASGYTASVNGEPASGSDHVSDGDFVTLSQAVKGGRK